LKTIIVYYSRTGRTARIARQWAHELDTSRFEIVPASYHGSTKEYLDYLVCTLTRKPMELDMYNMNFSKYDRVVLLVPVIWGMMSAPIRAFVQQEAGNIREVEYVIVHKGPCLHRLPKMVEWLDRHLGVKHVACSSIKQTFNKEFRIRSIDGESLLH